MNHCICILINNGRLQVHAEQGKPRPPRRTLPTREDQVKTLKSENYDVLIIGGGATGAGCALDACTRGTFLSCLFMFARYFNFLSLKV